MSQETAPFELSEVERHLTPSREIVGRNPAQVVPTGIKSARVFCKTCQHSWLTKEGTQRGQFHKSMCSVLVY